jgi:hypothetical protein
MCRDRIPTSGYATYQADDLSHDNEDFAELRQLAIWSDFEFQAQQFRIKPHQICTALKNFHRTRNWYFLPPPRL